MLKALGLKNKSNKEELVTKHQEQLRICNQWRQDSTNIKKITQKLSTSYQSSKGGFAMNRYEELKNMIKEATQHYKQLEQGMKTRPRQGSAGSAAEAGAQGGARKVGLISQLKRSAMGFASQQDEFHKQQKDYGDMSTKEIEAELEQLRKHILQYKQDFYTERDKIENLAKEYEESKKYNPTQRYTVLKNLIKSTTK